MFFQFLKIKKMAREAIADPGKLAAGEATGLVVGALILPVLFVGVILAALFTLGFIGVFGLGPWAFMRTLFYIGLVVTFLGGVVAYWVTKIARRAARRATETTINVGKSL